MLVGGAHPQQNGVSPAASLNGFGVGAQVPLHHTTSFQHPGATADSSAHFKRPAPPHAVATPTEGRYGSFVASDSLL